MKPVVQVVVIWAGKKFEVEMKPEEGASKLKSQLYQLTNVPESRQKIMPKNRGLWKGALQDNEDLTKYEWQDGVQLSLIGAADTAVANTKAQNIVFVEDMTTKQKQALGKSLPPGLENLGNTCYANSTLQCLRQIPELRKALSEYSASSLNDIGQRLSKTLSGLFDQMDHTPDSVTPTAFISTMRQKFPQFAQLMPKAAGFSQQDADEFFNAMINELSMHLTKKVSDVDFGENRNAIDALFGIETSVKLRCTESEEEPVVSSHEVFKRLQCKIDDSVKTLSEGLFLSLESTLEKHSEVLKRNANWQLTQRISRLPLYLTIQLNRFFWKLTPESRDHTGISCKINKPVKFPLELDVYDLCDEDLKHVLSGPRERQKQKVLKTKEAAIANKDAMQVEDSEEEAELQAALQLSQVGRTAGAGISPNFTGKYELFGVVTHKGRSSDSGHYMSWVKQATDSWVCFDDEHASECKDEDILKLSGDTPDWHIAYILFYRVKIE